MTLPPQVSAELTTFAPPAAPTIAAPAIEPEHSVARRLIERFALVAFGLYHLPLFLNNYPSFGGGGMSEGGLAISWGHVFTVPGLWVAKNVFQITTPMPNGNRGDNGDVAEEFARLLLAVVIAIGLAAWWTIADRNRPRARWTGDALRVMLRYSIALGLASYAVAKLQPMQFPPPNVITLEQRVGDLSPMTLLWTFMGYSQPYAFFGGVMELAVVLLLCFRRTATLGAIVCVAVMTNVALMNYGYGVPVKLYATMTVLSAMVLVLYDTPRLVALFVSNKTAPAARLSSLLQDRIPTPARWAIKFVLVGGVLLSSAVPMSGAIAGRTETAGIDGLWTVTSFAGDSARWKQVMVRGNFLSVRLATDSLVRCRATDPKPGTLPLTCAQNRSGDLRWTRTGDTLRIEGVLAGGRVTASARLAKPTDYRLMQAKFRWIMD